MSQNLKTLLIALVLIVVGAVFDHYVIRHLHHENQENTLVEKQTESSPESCEPTSPLKTKHAGISEDEIRDYLRTQNADEKLKKADAILARIMQVFVAELGLRLSTTEMKNFGQLPPAVAAPAPTPPPTATPVSKAALPVPPTSERRKQFLISIPNENSETNALQAVQSMSAVNMMENLKHSGPFTKEQIQELRGRFEGSIVFDNKTKGTQRVELEFNGRLEQDQLVGRSVLAIYDSEGKQRSRSVGTGSLNKTHSSYDSSLLIQAGSDIFELYYYPQMNQFIGNFYESGKGQYQRAGSVVLSRK